MQGLLVSKDGLRYSCVYGWHNPLLLFGYNKKTKKERVHETCLACRTPALDNFSYLCTQYKF